MALREKIAKEFHMMFTVPIEAVHISALEAKSKKQEDPTLNKEKKKNNQYLKMRQHL